MFLQPGEAPVAGDIAFYQSHGSFIDNLIVARTGSQIVHVAIFEDEHNTIAATSNGITRQPAGGEYAVWKYAIRPFLPVSRYDDAIAWLRAQVGKPYGYADIVNQVLLLTGKDPVLLDKSEDCSDLATKFLWIAGVLLPASFIDANTITPGGLYACLQAM